MSHPDAAAEGQALMTAEAHSLHDGLTAFWYVGIVVVGAIICVSFGWLLARVIKGYSK